MNGAVTGEAAAHDAQGRFVSGHSEYAARKRRLAERVARLRLDYDPSPSQEMLLVVIAGHLDDAERCRSAIARTRDTFKQLSGLRSATERMRKAGTLPKPYRVRLAEQRAAGIANDNDWTRQRRT